MGTSDSGIGNLYLALGKLFRARGFRFVWHPVHGILIYGAFKCRKTGKAIRCVKTIRWRAIARRHDGHNDPHFRARTRSGSDHDPEHGAAASIHARKSWLILEIDGETVVRLMPDIGYLHTGIEKTCEAKFYQQVVPLTDRIDYLCPMTNNLCYVLAVEKLSGLEIPPESAMAKSDDE